MTLCTTAWRGRRVVIARPDSSEPGRLSVDMLSALARARHHRADVFLLPPDGRAGAALFALEAHDVRRLDPRGADRAWLVARWRLACAAALMRTRRTTAAASFWLEIHRELRRQVGDDRLPYPLRVWLRRLADVASSRAATAERQRVAPRFSRAALRDALPMTLPAAVRARARDRIARFRIDPDEPMVTVDTAIPLHLLRQLVDPASAEGYRLVRVGDVSAPSREDRVVDVPMDEIDEAGLAYVLLQSAFVVCGGSALQRTAWLANRPSLLLDARDPFTAYPVRRDGIFTLAEAIDLDTGRRLEIAEQLEPSFFHNLRNYGFRHHGPAVLIAALREMFAGLRDGWRDTAGQVRVRELASTAGVIVGRAVPHLVEHDVASGFIGDGRLAAAQADGV